MWSIAQQTLLCGGNVYVHCIAELHRGATVPVLMRSRLASEHFADAVRYINGDPIAMCRSRRCSVKPEWRRG